MTATTRLPARWSLIDLGAHSKAATTTQGRLLWPAPPRSPLTPLLSGLTPNRDHNGDLLQALQTLPHDRADSQPVFAVFAADPFINGRRIAKAMRARGYQQVVNWPTTEQLGAAFAASLDSVGLGPKQECEALRRLAGEGLTISVAVASVALLEAFLDLKPQRLFVTPCFESWKNGRLEPAKLLRRCAAIAKAAAGRAPIVLMADRGTLSLEDARGAGADALLTA